VHFSISSSLLIPALFSMFLCGTSIVALRKSLVLEPVGMDVPQSEPDIPVSIPEPPSPRYLRSTLTAQESQIALQRLRLVMERDKPYLESNLTLAGLAEQIGLPAHHLSQVINEQCGQNFADFINSHRIEEAKRRLHDQHFAHYSILAISEDSGFHSKSTFNTAFKKHTGLTPSEFRKQISG
jgi:AraC-like DNA-binding protein